MADHKWMVLSNTTLGGLMASINGTITLISLPVIFNGLGINPFTPSNFTLLIWVLLGYGVVTATLLVTVGRFSDMFGRARLYNLGFAVFTLGSIMLFLTPGTGATGGWEIVAFRLVQAVGAAFLFANSPALLTDAFPANERGLALGINQVAFIGGSVVGLVLGGILAGAPTFFVAGHAVPAWRTIFLVSVPVGIFGTVWAYSSLHEMANVRKDQKLDLIGNLTFALGLTTLLISITYGLLPYGGQPMGWSNPSVWAGTGAGLALLVTFLLVESRVADPMFDLRLFRVRAFAVGNAAALMGSVARGGMMFMMIMWFQGIWLPLHGYAFSETPFWAGIYMLPMLAGFFVAGPLSGRLSDKHGAKHLASAGMGLGAATFFAMTLLPYDFPYWQMGLLLFLQGCGMGMFASPNQAAIMNSVPSERRGAAAGMTTTIQNTGQQLSMAMFFTIVIVGISGGLSTSVGGALAGAGTPAPDVAVLAHVLSSDPTGAIFGAFLGINPMGTVLGAFPLPVPISPSSPVYATLTSKAFFPTAIAPAFLDGVREALAVAGSLTLVATVISLLRGERYVHEDTVASKTATRAKGRRAPAATADERKEDVDREDRPDMTSSEKPSVSAEVPPLGPHTGPAREET